MSDIKNNPLGGLAEMAATGSDELDPLKWFAHRFPTAYNTYKEPLQLLTTDDLNQKVLSLNDNFFAAALGEPSAFSQPLLFLEAEEVFLVYDGDPLSSDFGTYRRITDREVESILNNLLIAFANDCQKQLDCSNITFKLSDHRNVREIMHRAKAMLQVKMRDFSRSLAPGLGCKNGYLLFSGWQLIPFSHHLKLRTKIHIEYKPEAQCSRFLSFLRDSLAPQEICLLQRWGGLVLSGENRSQAIMVLTGASGSGKSTILRILTQVIGENRVAQLRTKELNGRFEMGLLSGVSLLLGADVKSDFLQHQGAALLKSLTGGDSILIERKNCRERQQRNGSFNVGFTCNTLPLLKLDGDVDAWMRRLRVVTFRKRSGCVINPDLAAELLATEGSGILNWLLIGYQRLASANWQLDQTAEQKKLVEDFVGAADTVRFFVESAVFSSPGSKLTFASAFRGYQSFCEARGWTPQSEYAFGKGFKLQLQNQFAVKQRNDIPSGVGMCRGWHGLNLSVQIADASDAFL